MGININHAFPSKWLKAADLMGKEITVTIASVRMEDVGDEATKPVVYFQNKERGLVLNKTNANNISILYGPDTDNWVGKPITLYPAWVDFQGRSVEAIRVRPTAGQTMAQYQAQTPNNGGTKALPNDDIPF